MDFNWPIGFKQCEKDLSHALPSLSLCGCDPDFFGNFLSSNPAHNILFRIPLEGQGGQGEKEKGGYFFTRTLVKGYFQDWIKCSKFWGKKGGGKDDKTVVNSMPLSASLFCQKYFPRCNISRRKREERCHTLCSDWIDWLVGPIRFEIYTGLKTRRGKSG